MLSVKVTVPFKLVEDNVTSFLSDNVYPSGADISSIVYFPKGKLFNNFLHSYVEYILVGIFIFMLYNLNILLIISLYSLVAIIFIAVYRREPAADLAERFKPRPWRVSPWLLRGGWDVPVPTRG